MPLVYIIVLTYKMRDVAARCLASLRTVRYPNYRVVVVDNDSGDGTLEMVRERFPDYVAIQTGGNLGYTGGNNRGIERALAEGAEYVLILNPDTEVVNPDFLAEMVRHAEAHPDVGIAGPKVFLRERGVVQNTVLFPPGLWRNIANWVHFRIRPARFELSGDAAVEAEVLNGVCLLIRGACLRQIGLFDENIFMYIEDAEMDWRARGRGWRVQYLPIDSVIHWQKPEGYHMTGPVSFLLKRNSVYYLCKTGKRVDAWGYATLSLLLLLLRGALTLRRTSAAEYFVFAKRLALAYRAILLRRQLDANFDPQF
ncbi:MAG: glycosyltransferase family 2 protein [Burkholderiales bacterium]